MQCRVSFRVIFVLTENLYLLDPSVDLEYITSVHIDSYLHKAANLVFSPDVKKHELLGTSSKISSERIFKKYKYDSDT